MEITNYDQAAQVARVAGFYFYDTCQCGGTLQHKWKKGNKQLIIYPKRSMFRLHEINTGKSLFSGNFNDLEKTLNENTK